MLPEENLLHTFTGPDRGLWLVKERQKELMYEAAQDRLFRSVPLPERQTRAGGVRFGDIFASIALGQGRRLAAVRQVVAPEPCTDCADCSC